MSRWTPEGLRALEAAPATVVDVGAGSGTPALYDAYPDARHVLIEPLAERAAGLRTLAAGLPHGEVHVVAAGARREQRALRVEPRRHWRSSFLPRTPLTATGDALETRTVEVTTLDHLREERGLRPPFVVKIDTEGYELEVLEGARSVLAETELVVAEVSVAPRFVGGYRFAELIARLDALGFALVDLLDVVRDETTDRLKLVDAAFRPAS